MLSNYFTLFHSAALLNKRYARTVIAQVYSQDKNTLSILLYAPEPHTIIINCTPRENYILAREGDSRARANSVDLFPSLIDRHIESVYVSGTDRTIYFKISGNLWLCADIFASKANVVLCDVSGNVADTFLNKKELLGTIRSIQQTAVPVSVGNIVPTKEEFIAIVSEQGDILRRIKKSVPKFGTTLAQEVLHISKIDRQNFSPNDAENLFTVSSSVCQKLLERTETDSIVYFDEKSPVCFSLIPLEHCSAYRAETYADLFIGIQKFISFERSTSTFLQKKKEIVSWLVREEERAQRTITAVEKELAESSRAEQYELYANLIMTNLTTIPKGVKSVTVENPFSVNEGVTIPLDGSLTPQKNAEKFYEKAKKSKSGKEESLHRLLELKKRMTSVSDALEKIKRIDDGISFKNFLPSYGGMLKELGYMTDKEQEELPPFKIFAVDGGFTVYAGKNSSNNDELTFRYAKPNDLWFHARGSSGSHVVLKLGSAQGTPSKKAIEQAAAIAAYYSKMKNAKHVPVTMTERKHIRKPKGAPAGTVALEKEKVIFVQPVLPGNEA